LRPIPVIAERCSDRPVSADFVEEVGAGRILAGLAAIGSCG
jgi:hypothetical protein